MVRKIKSHSLEKLAIYIGPTHKVRHGERTLFRKLFPKSAYIHVVAEAKKDSIINTPAHSTHTSFTTDGNVITFSAEGDNSRLAMCVELIDKKEKFFLKHKDLLQSKIVIYKEVEFWDLD